MQRLGAGIKLIQASLFFSPFLFCTDFSLALFLAGIEDAAKCLGCAWVTW